MGGQVFSAGHSDARVVVHRAVLDASGRPCRRVEILGLEVGWAYSADDVKMIMARCEMDPADIDRPGVVEWRGDGPYLWG
ncbi:hypothetical protein ABIA32_000480 [Streptacidiphilus sp. MAP12-20]|uniref:hypothetical protein n=1 Tax=Streptacidiphilus sp. MAP12-20 TaxID=3156299 RepID=UPI00351576E7